MAMPRPGKYIEFDDDGMPVVKYSVPIPASAMTEILKASMQMPYMEALGGADGAESEVPSQLEQSLQGMTRFEAMAHRVAQKAAWGDMECVKFIYDRLLGKPAQQITTTNLNMTYQDFLQSQIDADKARELEAVSVPEVQIKRAEPIIEATVIHSSLVDTL